MKTKSLNILIIEDDNLLRLSLAKRLEHQGQIFEAKCTQEALSVLKNHKIDIAFIDLDLESKLSG
jgi:DNA-binding NarL/FixJ family response regulator